MGPLALLDFVGLDVSVAIGESLGVEVPRACARSSTRASSGASPARASTSTRAAELEGRVLALRLRRAALGLTRHSGGEVPDDVGLADALGLGELLDAVPRQLRLGQVVPAREVERLERARRARGRARPAP